MKRILIATIGMLGMASYSLGEGEVYFVNSSLTRISTNSVSGGPATGFVSGAGNYYFALFVAPPQVTSVDGVAFHDPNWSFTGNYATNTTRAGIIAGHPIPDSSVSIPGYAPGETASFVVVGWSANIAGSDLAAVEAWYGYDSSDVPFAGWFGQSAVATLQLGNGELIPNLSIFGTRRDYPFEYQAPGFTLNLIPEPTTIGLVGLGAVLLFWRLKTARCLQHGS